MLPVPFLLPHADFDKTPPGQGADRASGRTELWSLNQDMEGGHCLVTLAQGHDVGTGKGPLRLRHHVSGSVCYHAAEPMQNQTNGEGLRQDGGTSDSLYRHSGEHSVR